MNDYSEFAAKYLDVINKSGDELMVRCVFHDDSRASMQFNVRSGLWCCFGCDEGGSVKKLARHLGAPRVQDLEPSLKEVFDKLDALKRDVDKRHAPPVKDDSFLKRFEFPTDYWTGRGFLPETIEAFELGYDPVGNYATIPLRNTLGDLLGVTKRYLDDDIELKYKYPNKFQRTHNLFASWFVDRDDEDTIALTEGSVDSMMVWQAGFPSLAQYGSSISLTQIRLLRRMGVGRVILFYDDDNAGRKAVLRAKGTMIHNRKGKTQKTYEPAYDLRRDFLVEKVVYQKGDPSDPGDMSRDQIAAKMNHTVRV